MSRFCAVIPAAGLSLRMVRFKPLLPLGDSDVLTHCVQLFLSAGIDADDVIVVCGHRGDEVAEAATRLGVRHVLNSDYEQGMFSSIAAGVREVGSSAGSVDGFFVLPVDIPLVRSCTVSRLVDAFEENQSAVICPAFLDEPGHPPLIRADMIPEILAHDGDGGLRAVLSRHEKETRFVNVADAGTVFDLDHPGDYERAAIMAGCDYPLASEVRAMWNMEETPDNVREHSRAVAHVARAMTETLNAVANANLSPDLAEAAALAHDVARCRKHHAQEGAKVLASHGFQRVADIVAVHPDLDLEDEQPITEREIVFLADKLVFGDRFVPLAERYRGKLEKYGDDPDAAQAIQGRLDRAEKVAARFESQTGVGMDGFRF